MKCLRRAVVFLGFSALLAGSAGAANLVGDADHSGVLEMADAALAQDVLYGGVGANQISPLALADSDGDLDLADLMLLGQAVSGNAVLTGPGGLLSVTHPLDPILQDGASDFPVAFDVVSNYAAATRVDGLEVSVTMALGESTLSGASTTITAGQATASFTPVNASAPDDLYSIEAQIVVRDSLDAATTEILSDMMTVTVSSVSCSPIPCVAGETEQIVGSEDSWPNGSNPGSWTVFANAVFNGGQARRATNTSAIFTGNFTTQSGLAEFYVWILSRRVSTAPQDHSKTVSVDGSVVGVYDGLWTGGVNGPQWQMVGSVWLSAGAHDLTVQPVADWTQYFDGYALTTDPTLDPLNDFAPLTSYNLDDPALDYYQPGTPLAECCGDCVQQAGEACDWGIGYVDYDGCAQDCIFTYCGDGVAQGPEICDDGLQEGEGLCLNDCSGLQACGDGQTEGTEICDDGVANGTGEGLCLSDCADVQTCGDGAAEGAEFCDDGPNNGAGVGYCLPDCSAYETCGDGNLDPGETCDDGDLDPCTAACNQFCTGPSDIQVCGDGVVQCDEACDDGDLDPCTPSCNEFCTGPGIIPVCGDGVAECSEPCDDGAIEGEGSCLSDCSGLQRCGDGIANGSEACDDGDFNPCTAACNQLCTGPGTTAVCGDGARECAEACDDGNLIAGDGCDDLCMIEWGPCIPAEAARISGFGAAMAMAFDGPYLYVTTETDGIFSIDNSGPLAPTVIGSAPTYAVGYDAIDVAVLGNYAYTFGSGVGFASLDISDPYAPNKVGAFPTAPKIFKSLASDGSEIFAAGADRYLWEVDVSNPSAPFPFSVYDTGGSGITTHVEIDGARMFVTGGGNTGLHILTTSYVFLGYYYVGHGYSNVAAYGDRVYLVDGNVGLEILDVSNPGAPVALGSYGFPDPIMDIAALGEYVYVITFADGLYALDVSNPASPVLAATLSSFVYPYSLEINGPLVYVADYTGGVAVVSGLPGLCTPTCGNDVIEYPENCDDGVNNGSGGPYCSADCSDANVCGDGNLDPGEVCDDGDTEDCTAACNATCTGPGIVPVCGDSIAECGEVCDDGNAVSCDGCVSDCTRLDDLCGDGVAECGEACDDGDTNYCTAACNATCTGPGIVPVCGDGVAECGEPCDDGPVEGEGNCLNDCSGPQVCGDGAVNGTETCDDGDLNSCTVACDAFCAGPGITPVCGDGASECAEECDDGNTISGDGCSEFCFSESGTCVPQEVARVDPLSRAFDVKVSGGYAFAATDNSELMWSGLEIFDVSDPANPQLAGSYPLGDPNDITIIGGYVYASNGGSGLRILNVSNPLNVISLNTVLGWEPEEIAVVGNLAYSAHGNSGLIIYDVSNPVAPVLVGSYDTTGNARDIKVSGNYAYVADREDGLAILDVSNPASPAWIGGYDTAGWANGVAVDGGFVYVADDINGLVVIDVSNPSSPSLAGQYLTAGSAYDVEIYGGYAVVGDWTSGLVSIDISNPASPSLAGETDTGGTIVHVALDGGLAYLAEVSNPGSGRSWSGLSIIDVSIPSSPIKIGTHKGIGSAMAITFDGPYAYVTTEGHGLFSIDATDPLVPKVIGNAFVGDVGSIALDVVAIGGYAYTTSSGVGLVSLDLSDPFAPTKTGENAFLPTFVSLATDGTKLFAAGGYNNFVWMDGTPASLSPFQAWDTGAYTADLAIDGSRLYAVDGGTGLHIFDTLLSHLGTHFVGDGYGLASASGNRAYVVSTSNVLEAVDVANPAATSTLGTLPLPGIAYSIAALGDYVYVGLISDGLYVFDFSNPASPVLAAYLNDTLYPHDIKINGSLAYVADFWSGVGVLAGLPGLCAPTCGNGAIEYPEACDQGVLNGSGSGFCLADCSGIAP